jgi:hypothetical protein
MTGQSKSDDVKLRKEAAESLQRQIDDVASGRTQPRGPASFRDFVEHKMAEDRSKKSTTGMPPEPRKGDSPGNGPPSKSPPKRERK